VVVPLLVIGEVLMHRSASEVVWQFVEQQIVVGRARPGFDSGDRFGDGPRAIEPVEILLLVCAVSTGYTVTGAAARLPGRLV